jgi:hypothetical protein
LLPYILAPVCQLVKLAEPNVHLKEVLGEVTGAQLMSLVVAEVSDVLVVWLDVLCM